MFSRSSLPLRQRKRSGSLFHAIVEERNFYCLPSQARRSNCTSMRNRATHFPTWIKWGGHILQTHFCVLSRRPRMKGEPIPHVVGGECPSQFVLHIGGEQHPTTFLFVVSPCKRRKGNAHAYAPLERGANIILIYLFFRGAFAPHYRSLSCVVL